MNSFYSYGFAIIWSLLAWTPFKERRRRAEDDFLQTLLTNPLLLWGVGGVQSYSRKMSSQILICGLQVGWSCLCEQLLRVHKCSDFHSLVAPCQHSSGFPAGYLARGFAGDTKFSIEFWVLRGEGSTYLVLIRRTVFKSKSPNKVQRAESFSTNKPVLTQINW